MCRKHTTHQRVRRRSVSSTDDQRQRRIDEVARTSVADRGLAARASRGDVEAFRRLVQEHSGLVHRVALRTLGKEEAQDASQEVWVRVWANLKSFRGESAFSTWLYRIAVNTCLSIRRKESRRGEKEYGEEGQDLPEPLGGEADPQAAALGSERRGGGRGADGRGGGGGQRPAGLVGLEGVSHAEE